MMNKSALREAIQEVLEEHEIEDGALRDDLMDRLALDFGDEIYDDDEAEEEDDSPAEITEFQEE